MKSPTGVGRQTRPLQLFLIASLLSCEVKSELSPLGRLRGGRYNEKRM